MKLISKKVSFKRKWFGNQNSWLIVGDRDEYSKPFRFGYERQPAGVVKVFQDRDTGRYFLYETDGTSILLSTFYAGAGGILWENLNVYPYEDHRDSKTGMLIPAGTFIARTQS